ncbi:MAG: type IV pilin-like G/H family protein [Elainella sp. Prado103]|jgi:type II secretion system protein G|nr:type IV pilin-like G/H family protein [Elainella sp. Prado103]
MKSELKAKFLQHLLSKKKNNEGFTLIELLVVIIIIGILAAIALPSFLNQANKARQSEASTYVGTLNRAQQAYYLENRAFEADFDKLEVGLPSETKDYKYKSEVTATEAFSYGDPIKTDLKGVSGRVYVTTDAGGNATTKAFVCIQPKGDGGYPDLKGKTACP